MIPLGVLSFSKCSAGSVFQLWTGHYMSRHRPSWDRHLCRQTGTEVPGQSGYINMSTWWHCATATIGQLPFIATGLRSQERMCAVIKVIH